MQNVSNLVIPEGEVRTIHDEDSRLLWGTVSYDTKYTGNTYQQTYSGKNLLNLPDTVHTENQIRWTVSNSIHAVGKGTTVSNAGSYLNTATAINFDITGNFTFSISQAITAPLYIRFYSSSNANLGQIAISTGNTSKTGTIPSGAVSYRILLAPSPNTAYNIDIYLQLEKSSQPSAIEPYVGGIPSPNPDYPQDIQVVTGTQTITLSDGVNNHNYTVNLGSTELCQISTYQDYIYKSGNDWYVHKDTGRAVFSGASSEDWVVQNTGTANYFYKISSYPYGLSTSAYSNYFVRTPITNSNTSVGFSLNNSNELRFRPNFSELSVTDWKSWLNSHNVYVYYVLATPTDTKITDATLISQLDAIHQFLARYGYSYTVSGNLPIIIDRTAL